MGAVIVPGLAAASILLEPRMVTWGSFRRIIKRGFYNTDPRPVKNNGENQRVRFIMEYKNYTNFLNIEATWE